MPNLINQLKMAERADRRESGSLQESLKSAEFIHTKLLRLPRFFFRTSNFEKCEFVYHNAWGSCEHLSQSQCKTRLSGQVPVCVCVCVCLSAGSPSFVCLCVCVCVCAKSRPKFTRDPLGQAAVLWHWLQQHFFPLCQFVCAWLCGPAEPLLVSCHFSSVQLHRPSALALGGFLTTCFLPLQFCATPSPERFGIRGISCVCVCVCVAVCVCVCVGRHFLGCFKSLAKV